MSTLIQKTLQVANPTSAPVAPSASAVATQAILPENYHVLKIVAPFSAKARRISIPLPGLKSGDTKWANDEHLLISCSLGGLCQMLRSIAPDCVDEHIHLLISLGREQTISKIAMLIKGESSFWVNQQSIIHAKFEWQDDYIALSVSESAIERVRRYIANQEEHHRTKTFAQEYRDCLRALGFDASGF